MSTNTMQHHTTTHPHVTTVTTQQTTFSAVPAGGVGHRWPWTQPPAQDGEQEANGPLSTENDADAGQYTLPTLDPAALREWRIVHNYTRAELAAALDVNEKTISRWERGERDAPWRLLQLALHGLVFTHGASCRCGHRRCQYRPKRYAANGRAYDPY